MANDPTSMIRQIMDRLTESVITEGPFDSVKAAFGDKSSQGKLQQKELAKRLEDGWKTWLGQTGLKGSVEDMVKFLHVRAGFEVNDIREIMGQYSDAPLDSSDSESDDSDMDAEPETSSNDTPEEAAQKEESASDIAKHYGLTPEQEATLKNVGKLEMDDGRTLWVGDPSAPPPPTIRKIKNGDVEHAVDDLIKMSDDDFDKVVSASIENEISAEDWDLILKEIERREASYTAAGDDMDSQDIKDIVARLQQEMSLSESLIMEAGQAIPKNVVKNILTTAASYAFENGVLDRPENSGSAAPRGRQGGSSGGEGDDNSGMSSRAQAKINALLRQNDIDADLLFSLRETAKRARGLGSFKGVNDQKYLALIGMAYLKYRDN